MTLFEQRARLLADEEPGLSDELTAMLASEGVEVHLRAEVVEVTTDGSRRVVHARARNQRVSVAADAILLAAGRLPNVEGLGLEACGVAVGPDGVTTDRRGRTTVGSIYVAGDLHGRFRYANVARYEGVSSVRDAFFPLWTNRADLFPWCTFTDPELAHVGLTVAEAKPATATASTCGAATSAAPSGPASRAPAGPSWWSRPRAAWWVPTCWRHGPAR